MAPPIGRIGGGRIDLLAQDLIVAPQREIHLDGITHARVDPSISRASVRPARDEPVRPPNPLDLIGWAESRAGDAGPVELAAQSIHRLTRVTREKTMALFGDGLRSVLTRHGETGDRAWQAIADMPENDQRATLGALVDDL